MKWLLYIIPMFIDYCLEMHHDDFFFLNKKSFFLKTDAQEAR